MDLCCQMFVGKEVQVPRTDMASKCLGFCYLSVLLQCLFYCYETCVIEEPAITFDASFIPR